MHDPLTPEARSLLESVWADIELTLLPRVSPDRRERYAVDSFAAEVGADIAERAAHEPGIGNRPGFLYKSIERQVFWYLHRQDALDAQQVPLAFPDVAQAASEAAWGAQQEDDEYEDRFAELHGWIAEAIADGDVFTPRQVEMVRAIIGGGPEGQAMSYAEAGRRLGIRRSAAKRLVQRAGESLREFVVRRINGGEHAPTTESGEYDGTE